MTYAVLITAEKLMKRSTKAYRLIIASLIGSLFSLLIFFTADSFILRLLLKIVSSLLLTLTAFPYVSRRESVKTLLAVIIVSVIYSGMLILIYQVFRPPNMVIVNDVVYFEFNPLILLGSTALIYIAITVFQKMFRERIKSTVVTLQFSVENIDYSCVAKVDTGCNLTEPFTSAPVIIVDTAVFQISDRMHKRVIPYSTVGGASILYAVKADRVVIEGQRTYQDVYIASAAVRSDHVQAIINSDIVR